MLAARLHGPNRLAVESVAEARTPGEGEVLIAVRSVGICGSDLHTFRHARIGDTAVLEPLILGHEFAGVVLDSGRGARDGTGETLQPGMRVAVDPAQPCGRCEMCLRGDPNLCTALHFCGLFPDHGSLVERMVVPARTCFPVPGEVDDAAAVLLEPLGVAMHAVDLAHVRPGASVLIIGAGPIGLLILQVVKAVGRAGEVFVMEKLAWRRALAEKFGGIALQGTGAEGVAELLRKTRGGGVEYAFEAAWAGDAVQDACDAARPGARVLLVGIPGDDACEMKHSTARRKGLTLLFVRRMKHTYPRAIALVKSGTIQTAPLISHRFPLARAQEAFALNAGYGEGVVKVLLDVPQERWA